MKINDDVYEIKLWWAAVDQEFVAMCPAYPSMTWMDKDPGEAAKGLARLIQELRETQ